MNTPAAANGAASDAAADRATLAAADLALAQRFDRGDDIDVLLRARTQAVDVLVRDAWQRCVSTDAPLALFAVGGYGRGELFPHSDIDLLVLAEPAAQQAHQAALARLFALLWDAGLPAGHAVRSAAECSEAAAADITVLTAMLEARPLQTNAAEVARLHEAIAPSKAWPPREYCGHGIGKVYHDEPQVLHYGRPGEGVVLKPGMTFTIEPMINEGNRHTRLLPDAWTVVTKDRKLSAQWEHTVAVTADGVEILTRLPGDDNTL